MITLAPVAVKSALQGRLLLTPSVRVWGSRGTEGKGERGKGKGERGEGRGDRGKGKGERGRGKGEGGALKPDLCKIGCQRKVVD